MPRNRQPQAAAEKRAEIVAVARRLFVGAGYDATPMGALAAQANVTANTIYWYFSDKDGLFVAVLDEVMSEAWADYESMSTQSLANRLFWVVDRLQQMKRLVSTVHARAETSPVIAKWHNEFHELTDAVLRAELAQAGTPETVLDAEIKIGVFVVEGLLMHPTGEVRQREIIDALVGRWVHTSSF